MLIITNLFVLFSDNETSLQTEKSLSLFLKRFAVFFFIQIHLIHSDRASDRSVLSNSL
jgi:hypothetical protein